MSARRYTPPPKEGSSLSRRHTPSALNTTGVAGGSGSISKNFRSGATSKFSRTQSLLNLNNTTVGCPAIKGELFTCNTVDKKLECGMVYNDYLQALMKKEIVSNLIKKHEQDMNDQLAIQKDILHKTKMTLKNLRREIEEMDTLIRIDEFLSVLQENINKFLRLSEDFDLNEDLENMLELFELLCNKVHLKNVKPITDQEGIDKLTIILERCLETLTKIESSGRPIESVHKLSELMQKYQQLVSSVTQMQAALDKQHSNETFKVLKTLSDFYTRRENYDDLSSSYK